VSEGTIRGRACSRCSLNAAESRSHLALSKFGRGERREANGEFEERLASASAIVRDARGFEASIPDIGVSWLLCSFT
jgi:hypothetical protein